MDRLTRTANIIKAYYSYKKNSDSATFIKEVCGFFDFIKSEPISEADMNFLLFLANEAGIPQYFDLLKDKFTECRISDENIKTLTLSALFHDASLIRGNSKLHRYQKNVLDSFTARQQNRFVLTAPTSFGKTFLVYEIIQKILLNSYLSDGFLGMVHYYVNRKENPKTKDEAIRQVADFVYNVFKYHLVKYLGLFDVFFRYYISKSENIDMEQVAGLGLLLQKLEYNALSPTARKVSDYGVPFKLIDCYDSVTSYDKRQFDDYEAHIDQEISRLIQ